MYSKGIIVLKTDSEVRPAGPSRSQHGHFRPPVLLPSLFRTVVGDRTGSAIAFGYKAGGSDAFFSEVVAHRIGAELGQAQVVRIIAHIVGMAADLITFIALEFHVLYR